MARPKKSKPEYCRDKSSDRAFVTLNGKRKYLGPPGSYGSQASRDEYDRVIGEWIAAGRQMVKENKQQVTGITIATILAAFLTHAESYYRRADGTPTSELDNLKQALRPLHRLYGSTAAAEFGPLALEALQQEMIRLKWVRTHINRQVNRVRHVFKWAASKEMIPASVPQGLATAPGLRVGRSDADESEKVKPVPDAMLAATLPCLSRHVRAMVDLQLLTGARPGEIVAMRTYDIDRAGKVWIYRPPQHKTLHRGHTREIRLGPKAQKVIELFLKMDQQRFIFSPSEAEAERREKLHEQRLKSGTPMNQGNRPGEIHRRFRDRYTVTTYRRAIIRACEAAFKMPAELREPSTKTAIEAEMKLSDDVRKQRRAERMAKRSEWHDAHAWHPHQLRHTSATFLRKLYGIEAARLILGHRSAAVTAIYAEADASKAEQIMAEVG